MLTTLENAKSWLNMPDSASDVMLTRLITAASEFIENWCGRRFAKQEYTERRDGHGNDVMVLGAWPVSQVSSVVIDGQPASFVFDKTKVALLGGNRFTRGRMNVLITYQAGYDTTPPDIEQACIDLVALRFKERDRIGHQSKSMAGETVTFYIGELSPAARGVLTQYRKVVPI
ncbi:head-tail connector protein [Chromobacterium sp. LK1]|uniref:head-tail connector protein n=1 Tax=Chromobacterium sp. LK1 TaxID=1628193 RepID=UPI0006A000FE|nr:head-tail connector protein [Chromobacterium sp. LK1]